MKKTMKKTMRRAAHNGRARRPRKDADIATPVEEFGKQSVGAITTALGGKPVTPKSVQAKGLTVNQANYTTTSSQVWGCGS